MENEDVEAAYKSVVKGKERVKLIQEMIRRGVGFPGVEIFYKTQSQHCRVETFQGKRQLKHILSLMKLKLNEVMDFIHKPM